LVPAVSVANELTAHCFKYLVSICCSTCSMLSKIENCYDRNVFNFKI